MLDDAASVEVDVGGDIAIEVEVPAQGTIALSHAWKDSAGAFEVGRRRALGHGHRSRGNRFVGKGVAQSCCCSQCLQYRKVSRCSGLTVLAWGFG